MGDGDRIPDPSWSNGSDPQADAAANAGATGPDPDASQWPAQADVPDSIRFVPWDPARHPGRTRPVRGTYQPTGLSLTKGPVRDSAFLLIGLSFTVVALATFQPWTWGSNKPVGYPIYNSPCNGDNCDGGGGDGGQNLYPPPTDPQTTDDGYGDGNSDGTNPTDTTDPTDATDTTDPTDTSTTGGDSAVDLVVTEYYGDINQQDFSDAWALGGDNLGESYDEYVAGFGTTREDDVTIQYDEGDVVSADLTAIQTDGSQKTYTGEYTVINGAITMFNVQATN